MGICTKEEARKIARGIVDKELHKHRIEMTGELNSIRKDLFENVRDPSLSKEGRKRIEAVEKNCTIRTGEFNLGLSSMNKDLKYIRENVDEINKKVESQNKELIATLKEQKAEFSRKLEKKADISVEQDVKKAVWIVISAVIVGVLALIINR